MGGANFHIKAFKLHLVDQSELLSDLKALKFKLSSKQAVANTGLNSVRSACSSVNS